MDKINELQRKNIKTLIDSHLIGSIIAEAGIETYRITTENLIDFIKQNFSLKREGMDRIIKINK